MDESSVVENMLFPWVVEKSIHRKKQTDLFSSYCFYFVLNSFLIGAGFYP
ncbi:hypothetical protein ACFQ3C_10705 [Seohaeicola saemankumensis]|uniref:Uncharacterized protein n=1 Tax=Seohaeicola saemankumensis TaxID=481181 RepID=A0ABW3THC9_9RHOB